jgi:hypothetical protein
MAHGAAESVENAPTNYYTEIRVNERGKGGEEKVGVTTGRGNVPVGQDITQAGERRTNPSNRRNADGCIEHPCAQYIHARGRPFGRYGGSEM